MIGAPLLEPEPVSEDEQLRQAGFTKRERRMLFFLRWLAETGRIEDVPRPVGVEVHSVGP